MYCVWQVVKTRTIISNSPVLCSCSQHPEDRHISSRNMSLITMHKNYIYFSKCICCRSQWPGGIRRRSAAARLLRLWVRIPPGAWIFVCCECCVLSGRGLCDELITRPEESYRLWCFVVCDLETSRMRRPWPALGRSATAKKVYLLLFLNSFVKKERLFILTALTDRYEQWRHN